MTAPIEIDPAFQDRLARFRTKLAEDMRTLSPSRARSVAESLRKFVK